MFFHVYKFEFKLNPFADATLPRAEIPEELCLPSGQRDLPKSGRSTGMDSRREQSTAVGESSRISLLRIGKRSRSHGSSNDALILDFQPPTTGTEPDLTTSAYERPIPLEIKPALDPSSFPSFLTNADNDRIPHPTMSEKKSETFLSSPENLCQHHPPRP
jgi:hypothetical protein